MLGRRRAYVQPQAVMGPSQTSLVELDQTDTITLCRNPGQFTSKGEGGGTVPITRSESMLSRR